MVLGGLKAFQAALDNKSSTTQAMKKSVPKSLLQAHESQDSSQILNSIDNKMPAQKQKAAFASH